MPMVVLTWLLVLWTAQRWRQNLPPLDRLSALPREFPLGRLRWVLLALALLVVVLLVAVPVASLIWKAGLSGSPLTWTARGVGASMGKATQTGWWLVTDSLLMAAAAGILAGGCGLLICWSCRGSRWFSAFVLAMLAAIWAMPGPMLAFGLKDTINLVVPCRPLANVLYYGASPLPVIWADWLRFLPCAVALLWPVMRLLPVDLIEAARMDGRAPVKFS